MKKKEQIEVTEIERIANASRYAAQSASQLAAIVKDCLDYARERENSKRAADRVEAEAAVTIERLRSQRVVMEQFLSSSFAERRDSLRALLDRYDASVAAGNVQAALAVLAAFVSIAEKSPIEALLRPRPLPPKEVDWDL